MRYRVLSRGTIHSHTNICLTKSNIIDPWKGSRSGESMEFKIIPCYKSKDKSLILKSQNSKTYNIHQTNNARGINNEIKKVAH